MLFLTPYPLTPIGKFIGVVLALLPLISNIRKLSFAVWGYAIWIAVYCFQMFVNSIIWHDNVNIVAQVWCDIVTKLQGGVSVGTRACALLISIQLYKITRIQGPMERTKKQRRRAMIYELLVIIGFPFLIMALYVIIQPVRFVILEELGCNFTVYSYVGYFIQDAPPLLASLGCAILAPLTLRTFFRHRKEMGEFLSSNGDMSHNKYYRLMVITCLDTFFNLPVSIVSLASDIARGKDSTLNLPYVGWKNVHDGANGNLPGLSLSAILRTPASEWSTVPWAVFSVKWDEWLYVLHAVAFFLVFGTTSEMRSYYKSAFWFIPKRLGYRSRQDSGTGSLMLREMRFETNDANIDRHRCIHEKRRDSLSFLESRTSVSETATTRPSAIGVSVTGKLDLEAGGTALLSPPSM